MLRLIIEIRFYNEALGWLEDVFKEVQRFSDFQDFLLELLQVTLVFSTNRHTRDIPT